MKRHYVILLWGEDWDARYLVSEPFHKKKRLIRRKKETYL